MSSDWPDWSGQVVAIVAGGASTASLAPIIRGRCPIIAVNLAFRLLPEAEILYGADSGFWHIYGDARAHVGLKVCADEHARMYCDQLRFVNIPRPAPGVRHERLIPGPIGTVGNGGGNSGFQALNLAVQLGARHILLAGLDYGGKHWHEDHPTALRNPSAERLAFWRGHFDGTAETLRQWGIAVTNLSPISTLRAFPHVDAHSFFADQKPACLSPRRT